MVKHIVLYKVKEPVEENKAKAKTMLMSMEGKVPQIKKIEVGTNYLGSDRSYDVALTVTVDSKDALVAYQLDPYHVGTVKPCMHELREVSVTVDYLIEVGNNGNC